MASPVHENRIARNMITPRSASRRLAGRSYRLGAFENAWSPITSDVRAEIGVGGLRIPTLRAPACRRAEDEQKHRRRRRFGDCGGVADPEVADGVVRFVEAGELHVGDERIEIQA